LELVTRSVLVGIGATLILDAWNVLQKRAFAAQTPDWGLVGRWFGHLPTGRFIHDSIAKAAPIRGERSIGWAAHYAIGVGLATIALALFGLSWARHPSFLPALAFGVATVVAPFFILQPGMGAGIAASKTSNPTKARLRSLVTHTVFGVGLYLAALAQAAVLPQGVDLT